MICSDLEIFQDIWSHIVYLAEHDGDDDDDRRAVDPLKFLTGQ